MPERHPGKIEPAAALGERLTRGVGGQPGGSCSLFHSPAPKRREKGVWAQPCPQRLLVGLQRHRDPCWTGWKGSRWPRGSSLELEHSPPEPTVTPPPFLASLCGQGGTILSPEAEPCPQFLSPPSCLHLDLDLSLQDGAVCCDPPSVQG